MHVVRYEKLRLDDECEILRYSLKGHDWLWKKKKKTQKKKNTNQNEGSFHLQVHGISPPSKATIEVQLIHVCVCL